MVAEGLNVDKTLISRFDSTGGVLLVARTGAG